MTEPKYPKREKVFAIHYMRRLLETEAAQTIGPEGIALLVAIVDQEDKKRYAGPVDFWNNQLMIRCGFRSKGRLNRTRKAVIEAGWLHYESGGKSRAGVYWCLVPEQHCSQVTWQIESRYPVHNGTTNGTAKTVIGSKTEHQTDRQTPLSGPKQTPKRSPSIPIPHIPKSHMGDGASKKLGTQPGKTWKIDESEFQSAESAERRFRDAVDAGWLDESDQLRFHTLWIYTARQHARSDKGRIRKPGAAFTKAVKDRNWQGGDADEDAARDAIRSLTKPKANSSFGNLGAKFAVTVPQGVDDDPIC
jgi:hypothetical protein